MTLDSSEMFFIFSGVVGPDATSYGEHVLLQLTINSLFYSVIVNTSTNILFSFRDTINMTEISKSRTIALAISVGLGKIFH
jgi:hypothetical protein